MTLLEFLATTTGGVRSALSLLAVMALIVAWHTPRPEERVDIYRARTGLLFALGSALYSPAHASVLLDHPAPVIAVRLLDLSAAALACAALIHLLAGRALQRGVPYYRVRRAMVANASIIVSFVIAAWFIR